jgi:putative ABC transport system permease protein
VRLLDRKLLRDAFAMRGQVITIALIVAAGIAVFVGSISTYNSLQSSRDRFYLDARFPDIFATLKRAPLSILPQLNDIADITAVKARIVRDVIVDRPSSTLPVSARMVSIDNGGEETLSRLHMRSGTAPQPHDDHAVAINEAFAEANGIAPGQDLTVLLNGKLQVFHITGIALSPEYVYSVKPGLPIPDDRFYAVLWVDRSAAEAAFDLKGAFNDVVASLAPGADPKPVVANLDRILAPYGSVGAVERRDQPSNRFLEDELNQQKVMSVTVPLIFFGVSAFLLNVALGRLVATQREQIAALKAIGFPTAPIAAHYLKLVALVVLLGSGLGILGGIAFGRAMVASYTGFFRLADLHFEITPWSAAVGALVSFAAAAIGATSALNQIVRLAPAVAMRPAAPLRHRWFDWPAVRWVHVRRTMVLRNIAGRPIRAALTVIGVAFAVPMVVLGLFWRDAIDRMVDVQFNLVERGNVTVTFPQPMDRTIVGDLAREPGVLAVEGQRIVPVRLRFAHRSYLTSVLGLSANSELRRPHDTNLRAIDVSPEGITLTRQLAERLDVTTGDTIRVEVMEGRRRERDVPVSAVVNETIGMGSYMQIGTLNQLTGEGDVVSAAAIYVEPAALPLLSQRFKQLPVIESVGVKGFKLQSFFQKIANLVFVSAGVLTAFAVIITVGVVYNGARTGLRERAWELASLRVLGFTRAEVTQILLSEFAIEILLGIPLGLIFSRSIVELISRFHSNESFQIPAVIEPRTYTAAVVIILIAAAASAFVIRRQVDRLDLVSVLKARD